MTIRSIDLQVLIPRVTEVSRNVQISDQQSVAQQQLLAEQWQQVSASLRQQVQGTPRKEHGRVRPDDRQPGQNRKPPREQSGAAMPASPEQDASGAAGTDPVRGHLLDVKT